VPITAPLSAEARAKVIEANKGFAAADSLADLQRLIADILKIARIDASPKERGLQLAELEQAAVTLQLAMRHLHPKTRAELLEGLMFKLGWSGDFLPRLADALTVLCQAAVDLASQLGADDGRPTEARRDQIIATVCRWVDALPPLRSKAATRAAISRDAARDQLNVPLRAPTDYLNVRRAASVKVVLEDLQLFVPTDLRTIIRRTLTKKPR
jgi:hypothetical protein